MAVHDSSKILLKEQEDVITGSLLGDGGISKPSKGRQSHFVKNQKATRVNYQNWFSDLMGDWSKGVSTYTSKGGHKNQRGTIYKDSVYCQFRTCNHPIFTEMRKDWYVEGDKRGKKIVPKFLILSFPIIAIWFCDDGINCQERREVQFCTDDFPKDNVEFLINRLAIDVNFPASIFYHCRKPRICIKGDFYEQFINTITPFVVWEDFKYKISLDNYKKLRRNLSGKVQHANSKLSLQQVKDILITYPSKNTYELAELYNVSHQTISRILRGERWGGNKIINNINTTSGCKNVYYCKRDKYWFVIIRGKRLGTFNNYEDAVNLVNKVRNNA